MRNKEKWTPNKFVYVKGKLRASRDSNEVGVSSRLIADIVAGLYDEHIKEFAKGKLLDLGCGKVPFYEAYKEYVTENICIDWENSLHKNEYLDFNCDLTKPLPFEDEEFDTIILSDVLEHIPEPLQLFKEMSRILSKQGKILLNIPFYYWIHEQPHDYYRYTEFALKRFVESSGLNVELLIPVGGAPEVLTDIFVKTLLYYFPKAGRPLAAFAQWTTSAFIRTKLGKKTTRKTGRMFPLGYFLVAGK